MFAATLLRSTARPAVAAARRSAAPAPQRRGMAILPDFFGNSANNVVKNQARLQAHGVCRGAEAPTWYRSKRDLHIVYAVSGAMALMALYEVPKFYNIILNKGKHSPPV